MILARNLSGVPSTKPSARAVAKLTRQDAYDQYKASLPPPVVNTSIPQTYEAPARNAQMDEMTEYFASKRSLDEAHRSIANASQNAKMEALVGKAQKQILTTYTPQSTEVQEAFYLAQTDPDYFNKNQPNKELMKALASLYVEKGLMVPKALESVAPRPKLSLTDESKVLDMFREAISELEGQAVSAASVSEYSTVVEGVKKLMEDLSNTTFTYNPDEKVKLLAAAQATLDKANKHIDDFTVAERERVEQLEKGKKLAETKGFAHRASRLDTKIADAKTVLKAAEHAAIESSLASGSPLKGLAAEVGAVPANSLRPKQKEDKSMIPTSALLASSLASAGIGGSSAAAGFQTARPGQSSLAATGAAKEASAAKALEAAIRGLSTPELNSPANEEEMEKLRKAVGAPKYAGRGTRAHATGYAQKDDELLGRIRNERNQERPLRKQAEVGGHPDPDLAAALGLSF